MKRILIVIVLLFISQYIEACYCKNSPFHPDDYFNASYIFKGEVIKVEKCRVFFKIIKNYKGDLSNRDAYTDTKCDFYCGIMSQFNVGEVWLMWGKHREGFMFYTDDCTRSRIMKTVNNYELDQLEKISTQNGFSKIYSPDSICLAEGIVSSQKKQGAWKIYDKQGFIKRIATYKNDKPITKNISFHTPSYAVTPSEENKKIKLGFVPHYIGKVSNIILYDQQDRISSVKYFSREGRLTSQKLYKNGKQHGHIFSDYYSVHFVNGRRHGKYFNKHYKTGFIKCEGEFRKGQPIGPFRYYDENGKLIYEISDRFLEYDDVLKVIKSNKEKRTGDH